VRRGLDAGAPLARLRQVAQRDAYTIRIDLHAGDGEAVVYACDTTEAYVRINVEE
jgi:N-acetylglutamate synthase/N-acetylornithine aminotransferase